MREEDQEGGGGIRGPSTDYRSQGIVPWVLRRYPYLAYICTSTRTHTSRDKHRQQADGSAAGRSSGPEVAPRQGTAQHGRTASACWATLARSRFARLSTALPTNKEPPELGSAARTDLDLVQRISPYVVERGFSHLDPGSQSNHKPSKPNKPSKPSKLLSGQQAPSTKHRAPSCVFLSCLPKLPSFLAACPPHPRQPFPLSSCWRPSPLLSLARLPVFSCPSFNCQRLTTSVPLLPATLFPLFLLPFLSLLLPLAFFPCVRISFTLRLAAPALRPLPPCPRRQPFGFAPFDGPLPYVHLRRML